MHTFMVWSIVILNLVTFMVWFIVILNLVSLSWYGLLTFSTLCHFHGMVYCHSQLCVTFMVWSIVILNLVSLS